VTDVGSVKGEAVCWAHGQKFRNIEFIGAHPMAGSHAKGVSAAHAGLYDHSYSFLICDGNKKRNSYCLVKQFWRKICSRIIEIDARQHDRIVAEISHLPHIVAACLVLSVRDESLSFAASGFSDATRIAQSHPSIWLPIFDANRKEIIRAIKIFEGQIRAFKSALFPGNKRVLKGMVLQASRKRSQI
jgi:prephenate dehydrogenase